MILNGEADNKYKVFLGGTCVGWDWRSDLIPLLKENGIEYFNPLVDNWTRECQAIEEEQKKECDIHLYLVTSEMLGVYSIAEAVESACTPGKDCIYIPVNTKHLNPPQYKSMKAVQDLIVNHHGYAHSMEILESDTQPVIDYTIQLIEYVIKRRKRLDSMQKDLLSELKNF